MKPKARITSIGLSRVYNTGNYTNIKLKLGAEVPPGASARQTLLALSRILSAANPGPNIRRSDVERAERILANPEALGKDTVDPKRRRAFIRSQVKEAKELMAQVKRHEARRELALAALDNLGGTITEKDAKLSWGDDYYEEWNQ